MGPLLPHPITLISLLPALALLLTPPGLLLTYPSGDVHQRTTGHTHASALQAQGEKQQVQDTYQEGSTTAHANQPIPAGAVKRKGQASRKMGEKRCWETAKPSRGGGESGKQMSWGGMEETWVCFPFTLAAVSLLPEIFCPPKFSRTQSLASPGPVALAEK